MVKHKSADMSGGLTIITNLPKVIWKEGRVAANAPQLRPQKYAFPWTDYVPHPWTRRPMMPNGIRIRSAVFPQCTGQTDAPIDRSSTGKFDDKHHYASNESDAA